MILFGLLTETGLTASAGIVPEVADLGVEAGLMLFLMKAYTIPMRRTPTNADDDTNSLVDIELALALATAVCALQ